ncbi:RicAFT regulatory complex protein RicA family protein [Bacillus marasmi]|uniref:RicAFT regulatory complex protein RicA family protein n=1 Tax=Bacillus marasmi TaxID=1926279 RepID=UPI0011C7D643|nr:RicAFT regulatory complex protein RicA family protein [Bacillus marasmi]
MAKYTKDDIVARAKELAQMVAETDEVEFFKKAEAKIHENEKIAQTIKTIKGLQKQAVNLHHYGKENALQNVEDKIAKLEAELDEIPIVKEFKQSQIEVNEILQIIASTISNTVTDEIINSTGGDLLEGKTGAAVASSSCHHHDHDHDHE